LFPTCLDLSAAPTLSHLGKFLAWCVGKSAPRPRITAGRVVFPPPYCQGVPSFCHASATPIGEMSESVKTAQAVLDHSDLEATLNTCCSPHHVALSRQRSRVRVSSSPAILFLSLRMAPCHKSSSTLIADRKLPCALLQRVTKKHSLSTCTACAVSASRSNGLNPSAGIAIPKNRRSKRSRILRAPQPGAHS
jgi:hypothetical protein